MAANVEPSVKFALAGVFTPAELECYSWCCEKDFSLKEGWGAGGGGWLRPWSWGISHREHLRASFELPWAALLAVLFPRDEEEF